MATYYVSTSVADMTLNQGDSMYITKGGTATRTTAKSSAVIMVSSGGTALYTTFSAGGILHVSNGGLIINTTAINAGVFVSSGGIATLTTFYSSGFAFARFGGFLNSNTISSGGSIYVKSGGKANNTVIFSSGILTVSSGGVANYTTVNSGASVFIDERATIKSTTINSKGIMRISSGGTAYNTTVNVGGIFSVASGGTAVYTTTYGNGDFILTSGAVGLSTTVSGGSFSIGSECSATSTTVESGALLDIYSGSANVNIIKSGGSAVNRFGIMDSTTVKAGGVLDLRGGSALNIMEDGGYVKYSASVSMTFASNTFSGVKLGNAQSATVHSVTTANGTTVGSGGLLEVDGGRMNNTTVSSGGSVLFLGGVANGTVLNTGASFDLSTLNSSAVMSNTTIHSGISLVANYRILYDGVTVNKGSILSISAGGTATRVVENGGYVNWHSGNVTFASNTFSGVRLGSLDSATVHSGTTANGTVISNGGFMTISMKGIVNNTVISSGGSLFLLGGSAFDTVLSKGANLVLFPAYSGGKLIRTTISSGASVNVVKNVAVDSTTIHSMGSMAVASGGVASHTFLSGGKLDVNEGGLAASGTLGTNATLNVFAGGSASVFSLASRGFLNVSSGGSASATVVSSGGTLSVKSGGVANYTTLSGGLLAVSGGRVGIAVVEDGTLNISSGGSAAGIEVSSDGTVHVFNRGTLNGIESYSGNLYVHAAGCVTGRMYFLGDSIVSFDSGSTLDFDISIFSPGGTTACVNDLSFVTGTPDYTLTVWASQEEGKYKLANNAAGFNRTVTVKEAETGAILGTLKVGQTAKLGGVDYTLGLDGDSALSVTVGAAPPSPTGIARSDVNANGISDVMFQYTGGQGQIGFWMDGTSTWQSTNSTHPTDVWDVLGAYDMNANGKADSVLVGNTEIVGIKGAFIGYYTDSNDYDSNWVNISYLTNYEGYVWKNKVGNLTGNEGKNSIVWHTTDIGALGVWTDGTDHWESLGAGYDANWTLIGCGDFDGDGKDSVVMSYLNGSKYYAVDLDETLDGDNKGLAKELATSDSGWEVRAIADFAGDGRDDIIAFHKETGLVAMWGDGNSDNWSQLGQLDPTDWFVAGCGDYNADGKDDLLVRQYSTGMLGYYASGIQANWNVMGYGVGMEWTVIA